MRKNLKYLDIIYLAILFVWSAGLTIHVFKLALGPEFYQYVSQGSIFFVDFVKFYVLGLMIWAQQGAQIYNPAMQLDFYNQVIAPGHVHSVAFSEYPPNYMIMLAALPLLPLNLSFLVWNFGGLALSFIGLRSISKVVGKLTIMALLVLILAMLASVPGFRTVALGQSSWLYLAIVGLWCWAVLKKRNIWEGIALALSTIKFQYTPFLLLPALVAKRKSSLVAFVATEILMLLLAGLVLGFPNVFGYIQALQAAEDATNSNGRSPEMVNLRGLLSQIFYPTPALYISVLALLIVVVLVFLALQKKHSNDEKRNSQWQCALVILAALCFSPHTFIYDWLLLALPAVLLLDSVCISAILSISSKTEKMLCLSIWLYPVISWIVFLLPVAVSWRMLILFLYGLLLFVLCLKRR